MRDQASVIDSVGVGMSRKDVLQLLGEPLRVFADDPEAAYSWLYRDTRHDGGYSYVRFDAADAVVDVRGSMSFG
jgi:hypothetical protein